MDVSREAPDVATKPKCYDLTYILVLRFHCLDFQERNPQKRIEDNVKSAKAY